MKKAGRWLVTIMGVLLVIATLLPFIPTDEWWIRELDFPRLQLAILIAATVALLLIFFRERRDARILTIALAICMIYQLAEIFPYTPLAPIQTLPNNNPDTAQTINMLVANVRMDNRDAGRFLTEVERNNPDVVLVLEPDDWWAEQISALEQTYPHMVKRPLSNTYGILLYSRLPLLRSEVRYLVEDTIPSIVATVQLRSGAQMELYCVHPRPPIPRSDSEQRDAELLIVARQVAKDGRPSIVIGDLNDVAWSRTTELFQEISGLLDPRRGRGFYNSYHVDYFFLRYPLDHVFHSDQFQLADIRRGEDIGSDHFPILATLVYNPEAAPLQEGPKAEEDEHEEAEEMIEKGKKEE